LEVMMRTVFLKETVRPCPSVKIPSSITCKRIFRTSLCAFSNSSNKTTECGARRTASVNWPPSSCSSRHLLLVLFLQIPVTQTSEETKPWNRHLLIDSHYTYISHESRGRSRQAADGKLFHIFRHVDANEISLGSIVGICQCLAQFRLAGSGRSAKQKGRYGPTWISLRWAYRINSK
jgi:hypothetical protein